VASPFDGYEVEAQLRPAAQDYAFELDRVLSGVVALEARVPESAFTAPTLGTERVGNGAVIAANGLVLTMGYLVMEAEEVALTLGSGARVEAHVLGADPVTGFGLVQALEPLSLPPLTLGDSRRLRAEAPVVIAGAGGRAHAAAGHVLARMQFAGYWEYLLESAILTEPAHPHWSGAALINATGELVGMASLAMQGQTQGGAPRPINMCVPIDLLPPILDDLTRGRPQQPPRPWLGVIAHEVSGHVMVASVNPHGPAARAELRSGDVILAVGEEKVSDLAGFYTRMWALGTAGVTVPLRIQREMDVFPVEIRSADRAAMLKKPRLN
jgi:S1-C subfamily serine protease